MRKWGREEAVFQETTCWAACAGNCQHVWLPDLVLRPHSWLSHFLMQMRSSGLVFPGQAVMREKQAKSVALRLLCCWYKSNARQHLASGNIFITLWGPNLSKREPGLIFASSDKRQGTKGLSRLIVIFLPWLEASSWGLFLASWGWAAYQVLRKCLRVLAWVLELFLYNSHVFFKIA